MATMG